MNQGIISKDIKINSKMKEEFKKKLLSLSENITEKHKTNKIPKNSKKHPATQNPSLLEGIGKSSKITMSGMTIITEGSKTREEITSTTRTTSKVKAINRGIQIKKGIIIIIIKDKILIQREDSAKIGETFKRTMISTS